MENQKPFVSIIMPVYNCANDVERAIESILEQTLKEWELLIIDDCSTDNTCEVVNTFVKKDSRIILVCQEQNGGPGKAKNTGIQRATGEYITFCDADDWLDKEMYFKMSSGMTADEDVIIAGYYRDIHNEKDVLIERNKVQMHPFKYLEKSVIIENIPQIDKMRLFSFAWNKFYKNNIIQQYGIEFSNKKFGEDYDFNIEFFQYAQSACMLEECFYHYIKKNTESLTERYVPDFYEINRERFEKMKKLMQGNNSYTQNARGIVLTLYIKHVLAAIARLYDRRGKNSFSMRREKVKKMLKDEMSKEALQYAEAESLGGKVCNAIFKSRNVLINLMFGKMLWFMQNQGKTLYERIKK